VKNNQEHGNTKHRLATINFYSQNYYNLSQCQMHSTYMVVSAYIIQNKYVTQLHQLMNSFLLKLKVENQMKHIYYILSVHICRSMYHIWFRTKTLDIAAISRTNGMTREKRQTAWYYPCIKCNIFHNTTKMLPE
jgi:hypothetical protein